jgi:hypothetical protein
MHQPQAVLYTRLPLVDLATVRREAFRAGYAAASDSCGNPLAISLPLELTP